MAVRNKVDLLTALNGFIGENSTDQALSLIEDVTDTFTAFEGKEPGEDWETKYNQLDADWRKRYKDRFFNTPEGVVEDNKEDLQEESKPKEFEDLFEEREG